MRLFQHFRLAESRWHRLWRTRSFGELMGCWCCWCLSRPSLNQLQEEFLSGSWWRVLCCSVFTPWVFIPSGVLDIAAAQESDSDQSGSIEFQAGRLSSQRLVETLDQIKASLVRKTMKNLAKQVLFCLESSKPENSKVCFLENSQTCRWDHFHYVNASRRRQK